MHNTTVLKKKVKLLQQREKHAEACYQTVCIVVALFSFDKAVSHHSIVINTKTAHLSIPQI